LSETFSGRANSRQEEQLNINVLSASGLSGGDSKQRRTIELQYPGEAEHASGNDGSAHDKESVLGSKMIVYYEYIDPETG
jgi:hypothetical protein